MYHLIIQCTEACFGSICLSDMSKLSKGQRNKIDAKEDLTELYSENIYRKKTITFVQNFPKVTNFKGSIRIWL